MLGGSSAAHRHENRSGLPGTELRHTVIEAGDFAHDSRMSRQRVPGDLMYDWVGASLLVTLADIAGKGVTLQEHP